MAYHPNSGPMLAYNMLDRPPSRPTTPAAINRPDPFASASTSKLSSSVPTQPTHPSQPKPEAPFEFTVPSLPPRLANFGRKISQMRDEFMADIGEIPPSNIKQTSREFGGITARDRELRDEMIRKGREREGNAPAAGGGAEVSLGGPTDEVPGMGDEPIMCPFCDKPLPPAVFAQHSQKHRSPARPRGLSRSATLNSVPTQGALKTALAGPSKLSAHVVQPKLLAALPVEAGKKVEKGEMDEKTIASNVADGDKANLAGAKSIISEEDIKRWSKVAGIHPKEEAKEEKPIPKLLPPPGGKPVPSRTASNSSSRFNFFKKEQKEEDESDDEGGPGGYAQLTGEASDTDEEDDKKKILKDEPEEIEPEKATVEEKQPEAAFAEPTAAPAPIASNEDLQRVLQEVLSKITEMSKSYGDLLNSQSSLLTSLKISRSNLVMAEANTEMLEAQLKQAKVASPQAGGVPRTPLSNIVTERRSEDRTRPTSMQLPGGDKSGWGFWNNGKKKTPGPGSVTSPVSADRAIDFQSLTAVPYSPGPVAQTPEVARLSSEALGMQRSSSLQQVSTSPAGGAATATHSPVYVNELAKLRQTYLQSQTRITEMTKELDALKQGKLDMEAELENLSQALFEEANKMVADERRKRAEVEENLKELKEEKEALKQTIKVLGGGTSRDESASEKSADGEEDDKVGDIDFAPRDLDKHYEALRKSIHHVADGVTPSPFAPPVPGFVSDYSMGSKPDALEKPEIASQRATPDPGPEETVEEESVMDDPTPLAPPADLNPWASSLPPETVPLPGEDKLDLRSSISHDASRSSADQNLDRLMKDIQADLKE